jgi:NADPH-dependent stearoyl-CoA 9-desaturase
MKQKVRTINAWKFGKTNDLEAFAAEIDAVRKFITDQIGPGDVAYIKKIKRISRFSEAIGRALIHFSLDPFTWSAGVFALWIHKQLDTAEIGHNALHGCWDGLEGAKEFQSATFKWNAPVEEESWKRGHNLLHHQYVNIVGRDPDVNFNLLRITDQTAWSPRHLIQVLQFFILAPGFMWFLNPYFTGLGDLTRKFGTDGYTDVLPDRKPKTILKAGYQSAKKLIPYFATNYLFWPLLAGPFWWKVFGGNLVADALRNIYCCTSIYAGHFGDDLEYHDKSFRTTGRGEWYKMQVEAAHDFKAPRLLSILCGALDHQIEHHLFPRVPPNRLRQIQPKIEEICRRYGIKYQRETWKKNLKEAFHRIFKMSFPWNHAGAALPSSPS